MKWSRRWGLCPGRFKPLYVVVACLMAMYIFLNLWSVEKINYELKQLPEIHPDGGNIGGEIDIVPGDIMNAADDRKSHRRLVGRKFKVPFDRSFPDGRLDPGHFDSMDEKHHAVPDDIIDEMFFDTDKEDRQGTGNYIVPNDLGNEDVEAEYGKQEVLHDEHDNENLWTGHAREGDGERETMFAVVNGEASFIREDNFPKNVIKEPDNHQYYSDADATPLENATTQTQTDKNHDGVMDAADGEDGNDRDNWLPQGDKYEMTKALNSSLDQGNQKMEEPFMVILEDDKKAFTYEVDLSKVILSDSVTFPPYVDVALSNGPGEEGRPFKFSKDELTREEESQRLTDYKIHFFDLWISRKISVHRSLFDVRSQSCQQTTYTFRFPTISIIMVFFNEAWSTLLRSVHSILDRSEKGAITEIILLDDGSSLDHLKEPLERYLHPLQIVRLIRSSQRLGLIKARNLAFMYAVGEIIIFLDSHIECFEGWLEPLIQPIVEDYKTVTWPTINTISKEDFGIRTLIGVFVGGLNFNGVSFTWIRRPDDGRLYHDSPIMPGGLYAISRKWFQHLGAYDPSLRIWGGENVEISLKIWMCGGAIRLSMCSHVGHIFRTQSPVAKENSAAASFVNSVRIAEVWMDEYKHFFYERIGYNLPQYGDVSDRKALRAQLKCQNFQWYIDNVYKELEEMLDVKGRYTGTIRNIDSNRCFLDSRFKLLPCDQKFSVQIWMLRTKGYLCSSYGRVIGLKRDQYDRESLDLLTFDFRRDEPNYLRWEYDQNKRLVRKGTNECLEAGLGFRVSLAPCSNDSSQAWELQTREDFRQSLQETKVNKIIN